MSFKSFAIVVAVALTSACTTIAYPVKAHGFIVTDTPCPQDDSKKIIYRESDKSLACYSLVDYRGDTYIAANFHGKDVWMLFYKGVSK